MAPARIISSGTAVQAVVAAWPNGCNNLPEALTEVATNLAIHGCGRRELHLITSGVRTGPGLANLAQKDHAQRVAQLDPEFAAALRTTAAQLNRVTVHFLTAAQRRGLIAGAERRSLDIHFRAQVGTLMPLIRAVALAALLPLRCCLRRQGRNALPSNAVRLRPRLGRKGGAAGGAIRFVHRAPGQGVTFVFVPPAREMFPDAEGRVAQVPALFPAGLHVAHAPEGAVYFANRFRGAFTV